MRGNQESYVHFEIIGIFKMDELLQFSDSFLALFGHRQRFLPRRAEEFDRRSINYSPTMLRDLDRLPFAIAQIYVYLFWMFLLADFANSSESFEFRSIMDRTRLDNVNRGVPNLIRNRTAMCLEIASGDK